MRVRSLRAVAAALAGAALMLLPACRPPEPLPDLGPAPDFSLTERSGAPFDSADLRGRTWIADFIFTRCALSCPLMTSQMKTVYTVLPEDIRFVSISVDPEYDTPEVLSAYAERYGVEGSRWAFLTGDRDAIYSISIDGFHLGVDDAMGTEAEPIVHSTRFVLVDAAGFIRGYYDGLEPDAVDRLIRDASRLGEE